jgi:hypothetical protein
VGVVVETNLNNRKPTRKPGRLSKSARTLLKLTQKSERTASSWRRRNML